MACLSRSITTWGSKRGTKCGTRSGTWTWLSPCYPKLRKVCPAVILATHGHPPLPEAGHRPPVPRELDLLRDDIQLFARRAAHPVSDPNRGARSVTQETKLEIRTLSPLQRPGCDTRVRLSGRDFTRADRSHLAGALAPGPECARREAIANTSLLRSVLLLTSFAHHGGGSLSGLLDRYLTAPKLA